MRIATVEDLIDADDFAGGYAPPNFDYEAALARIRPFQSELERLTGLAFQLDGAQDATFFADISARDPVPRNLNGNQIIETFVAVRFSAFGNLFTIWSTSSTRPLTDEERRGVAELVSAAGFLYAPVELLQLPYSGVQFSQHDIQDWWQHFFEYD